MGKYEVNGQKMERLQIYSYLGNTFGYDSGVVA